MVYPSLLWQNGLPHNRVCFPENAGGRPEPAEGRISARTLEDLLPEGAFAGLTAGYFRFPCTPEEIRCRQKLLWKLSHSEGLPEAFALTAEEVSRFAQLYHRFCSSEMAAGHRALLFPALAEGFLRLCRQFAALFPDSCTEEETGYGAAAGACFARILSDDRTHRLEEQLRAFRSHRRDGVKLSIQNGSITAFTAPSPRFEETLRQYFADMGLEDACPAPRVHRADSLVIDAYGSVYPDIVDRARRMMEEFLPLLREEWSMEDLLLYRQEMQFCRDVCAYVQKIESMGYSMCLPKVASARCIRLRSLRDISLARREMRGEDVIPNDVQMQAEDKTHFYYVTGANGGGKTTYLRALGLAMVLFLTGCPVGALSGEIWPFTRLCSHFPSQENFEDTGRFVDEVRRAEEIQSVADEDTVALFNETFSGTDEQKSEDFSRRLAEDMYSKNTFGLYVTHIHTLTHGAIPTLAAVVDETDANRRTYRIRPTGGTDSSFAGDILKKYRLSEEGLAERLAEKNHRKGGQA